MTKTSFSSFLVEGVDPKHPGLAKRLDDIREFRGNESVADHEIAILRIGDTTDATLLAAYLDWMGENLRITDAPKSLRLRQEHMLKVLLHSDFDVTTQARLRVERLLRGQPPSNAAS
ncbi:MAG: hypothetical protein SF187_07095 [Deltaproteobacteria bacterium]|nr:hypothetical protein [Deltaproteobacteria bacterium]